MAPVDFTADVRLFTPGRACAGPLAIVLHGFSSGIEALDAAMQFCPRRRPAQSPGCHTSYHYGVGPCTTHQYVDIANTAWGFGVTAPTCPEPVCDPTPCESCTGLTADQYQPDFDGVAPTLPAWAVGPDGTVNCAVIHVAVTGAGTRTPLDNSLDCCNFFGGQFVNEPIEGCDFRNTKGYRCFVAQLCQIFIDSGLDPSADTLLIHCEELDCIDPVALAEDILACIEAPIPPPIPCNCAPTADQLCATLATIEEGEEAVPGVTLLLGADCLTHTLPASAGGTTVAVTDTPTLNLSVVEAPPDTFTVSGVVLNPVPVIPACAVAEQTPLGFGLRLAESGVTPGTTAWVNENADPTYTTGAGSYNVVELLTGVEVVGVSKNVLLVTGGPITLTNPPIADCLNKHLYIKNLDNEPVVINAAALIDGQASITLQGTVIAGYPFGNDGGESVHLIWDSAGATWYIL